MLTDEHILIEMEKIFKSRSHLSNRGLCYALWQGFNPSIEQNRRILDLLQKYADTPLAEKFKMNSYWWPVGQRTPRLATIQRAIKSLN